MLDLSGAKKYTTCGNKYSVGTSAMDFTVQLMQKLNYLKKFQDTK
jgi:hypothetical protein